MASKHVIEKPPTAELSLDEEMAFLEENDLFDMANLPSKYTGIDGVIMISADIPKLPMGRGSSTSRRPARGSKAFPFP